MLKSSMSVVAALMLVPAAASAQTYPERPVTVVVPYAPGGATDLSARLVLKQMETTLNQPFVVENRAGAAGAVGATGVAQSKPDGYTLMFDNIGVLSMNHHLNPTLPYDPVTDFAPIGIAVKSSQALVVGPTVEAETVEEFFEQARAEPGKFRYGSGGVGTGTHVFTEYMKSAAGLDIEHIPYSSSGPALIGLMAGEIDMQLEGSSNVLGHVQSGQLRALAVTRPERDDVYPDVPTLAEAAIPGFSIQAWSAFSAPAGTPDEIIQTLNTALNDALADPELQKQLAGYGLTPAGGTPEEAAAFISEQRELWGKVIKDNNIQPQ